MDIIDKIELESFYEQQNNYDQSKETMAEFWAWWKAECARRDAVPKHIVRSDRWQDQDSSRKGKRK